MRDITLTPRRLSAQRVTSLGLVGVGFTHPTSIAAKMGDAPIFTAGHIGCAASHSVIHAISDSCAAMIPPASAFTSGSLPYCSTIRAIATAP